MVQRKVCVVIASRANYARIKSVLEAIRSHPELELQIVVGASALLYRFGKVIDLIRKDGFNVQATVYFILEGENPTTMAKSTGIAISELATIFENLRPDVVLTVADRFETMATALAACYMNLPLAHTQGGEITGSIDESVRHAITKFAHVHFPATQKSADRIIRMGEQPESVFVTGCPSIDIIAGLNLTLPQDIFSRYGGVGAELDPTKPYFVVLQHPVTTEYGQGMDQIQETLEAIDFFKVQTAWLWPNVDAGSDEISRGLRIFRENRQVGHIHFFKNFSVEDYARLMFNSACVIGNSSSAIREGSFLGVPAVNIGTRQQGRERGRNVIDVGYSAGEIIEATQIQLAHGRYPQDFLYGDGGAGPRIASILAQVKFNIQKRLTY